MEKVYIYIMLCGFFSCVSAMNQNISKSPLGSNLFSNRPDHRARLYERLFNLSDIIHSLQWKTVAVLQTSEIESTSVTSILQPNLYGTSIAIYIINPYNASETLSLLHNNMFPDINILAIDTGYLSNLLTKVDKYDEETNFTTDFRHHSKWLIIAENKDFLHVEKQISFLENVVVITPDMTSETKSNQLHLTLRRHPHGSVFSPVSQCGADISLCYFPNVKYGYNNRRLRIMVVESDIHVIKEVENGVIFYKGYALDILDVVARRLNFSCDITEPSDGFWGLYENGKWNGIVGSIQKQMVDLAASDLTIHEDRSKVVDFIYPPIKTDTTVVIYNKQNHKNFFLLAQPFRSEVYIAIIGVTVLVVIIFKCAEVRVQQDDYHGTAPCLKCVLKRFLTENNHIGRALCKQGTTKSPETAAGKLLVSMWWLFVIIMTSVYSANLIASFSIKKDVQPFTTMQELLNSDYAIGMRTVAITQTIFENSGKPVYFQLSEILLQQDPVLSYLNVSEHIKKVKKEKYAFITYRKNAEMLMAQDMDLEILDENLSWEHLAFAVPRQSPLKTDIETIMYNLQESGLLDILWRKWFISRNATVRKNEVKLEPISLRTLGEVGIIISVGIFLAAISLVLEKLLHVHSYCL